MDNLENVGKKPGGNMNYYYPRSNHIYSPTNATVENGKELIKKIPVPPAGTVDTVLPQKPPQPLTTSLTTPLGKEAPLGKPEPETASEVLSDEEVLKHTASLWKYQPVPKDEPEPYDEYITESATLGGFHVTAARVRGKKHKHEGTNCDDWFETRYIEGFVVLAVSDGAGSKKFSRIGAKASCEGAMKYLETEVKKLLLKDFQLKSHLELGLTDIRFQQAASRMAQLAQQAVLAARQNVIRAWQERQGESTYTRAVNRRLQLHDFAATFLLTIALPMEASGETFIVSCQVGDGMTAAITSQAPYEQAVTLLGNADSGTFSGETEFLTGSSVGSLQCLMNRTRVARKKVDVIFSMTDGVADDYEPNGTELPRLYLDLLVNRVILSPVLEGLLKHMNRDHLMEWKKSVPTPQSYPSISEDPEPRMVPVQYVRELCEKQGIDLKALWQDHRELLAVMADAIHLNKDKNPATRLKEWLDNYVVRGSFDDRTLVILQRSRD